MNNKSRDLRITTNVESKTIIAVNTEDAHTQTKQEAVTMARSVKLSIVCAARVCC